MAWVLLALVVGSLVFCLLMIEAARRYLTVRPRPLTAAVPISILKPLAGLDEGLEVNLRSFFQQNYPAPFELLFAVRNEQDPSVAVVRRLQIQFPRIPSSLLIVGDAPYANAKVFSLDHMMQSAQYDLLVMSDSDIRVTPEMLRVVAAEFQDPDLGITTCPYRAVPGNTIWSRLEAIMMNTEFLGGILIARMLEGMRFAVGPTIVARRHVLEAIGGWEMLKDYLAEDFVMGQRAAEMGYGVGLSSYVIEHRIGASRLGANASHRIRWVRSTRRSRPAGYVGQLFTYPIPLALLLLAVQPSWWPVVAVTFALRAAAAWMVAGRILHDPLTAARWWLVPIQDVVSLLFWCAGFFGNTIHWRGRAYYLRRDGRFTLLQ
jgi:ceramide glucosyltransferase